MGRSTALRRRLEAVNVLQAHAAGIAVKDLARELDVSIPTAYRIIVDLDLAGLGIEHLPLSRKRLTNTRTALPLLLESGWRHGLKALQAAHPELDKTFLQSVLRAIVDGNQQRVKWTPSERATIEAIDHRLPITFSYRDLPQTRTRQWLVEPLGLQLTDLDLCLHAYCPELRSSRCFSIRRMQNARVTELRIQSRVPRERKNEVAKPHCVVRLTESAAPQIEEHPLHHAQEVEAETGGSFLVAARVPLAKAVRWTLGWGCDASPVSPRELRDEVRRKLPAP